MATTNANKELLTRAVEDIVPRKLAEEKLKSGKPMRLYLGIDPTGARLHIGHSVPLRKLKAFQDAGHHIIFLIGSFTAMIGDPTGRDTMREALTKEQVMKNFETYKQQASKVLDFSKLELRYNHEWLEKMNFADIMKLNSHFTVQQMLERDMFKTRMSLKTHCPKCQQIVLLASLETGQEILPKFSGDEWPWEVTCKNCHTVFKPKRSELIDAESISSNEFLYPLMQGYDSVMLDVDCEIGGNDQLFNMLCGRKLQKIYGKREKFVLTTKLIEGTDGRKMSKTYDNCIWLEDSAKDMYGKTMSIKDDLILTYMECCTDMPMNEVEDARTQLANGANPRDIKMRLARELVTLYHSEAQAQHAEEEFKNVFAKGDVPEDMPEIKAEKGMLLVDLLAAHAVTSSKSEARRLIEQKAVKHDDKLVTALDAKAEKGIYKVGKRKFVRVI